MEQEKYHGILFSDIVQLCCLNMLTGVCTVTENKFKGHVFIKQGEVVHASVGNIMGEDAFYRVMLHSHGDIEFKEGPVDVTKTITSPWEHLLMEGSRLKDQQESEPEKTGPANPPVKSSFIQLLVKRIPMPDSAQKNGHQVRGRKAGFPGIIWKGDIAEECIIDIVRDEGASIRTLGSFKLGDRIRLSFKIPPRQEEVRVNAEISAIDEDTISVEAHFFNISEHAKKLIGFYIWNA